MIISIDPGLDYFACAKWDEHGRLIGAEFYEVPLSPRTEPAARAVSVGGMFGAILEPYLRDDCSRVVFESPVIYPKSKAPPNDIMHLYGAVVAMAQVCAEYFVRAEFVEPRKWKGNVPKAVFGERIESRLTPKEHQLAHLERFPKTKRHDVVDAIGIGLWWLRRLK